MRIETRDFGLFELAEKTGVSRWTLREWTARGTLHYIVVGRRNRKYEWPDIVIACILAELQRMGVNFRLMRDAAAFLRPLLEGEMLWAMLGERPIWLLIDARVAGKPRLSLIRDPDLLTAACRTGGVKIVIRLNAAVSARIAIDDLIADKRLAGDRQ